MPEVQCKTWLAEQIQTTAPASVLDVGCGTGTFLVFAITKRPGLRCVGLDVDKGVLRFARAKLRRFPKVKLVCGFADEAPFPPGAFDVAFSSLVFHHLERSVKAKAASDVFRVLKPGGSFYLADFGPPHNKAMNILQILWSGIHRGDRLVDNLGGKLPEILDAAGFVPVDSVKNFNTAFGSWVVYRAIKPATCAVPL